MFFFFSSRRRHTRCSRDWSSDVLLFRSHRGEVAELGVGEFDDPTNRAVPGIEANQVRVGSGEVEPVLIHAQAAIADVIAFGNTLVMPDLAAIARSEEHTSELQSRLHLVCRL